MAGRSLRAPDPPGDQGVPAVKRPRHATQRERSPTLSELRSRLAEAEETLRAISNGEVDAVVTDGRNGPRVFTLEGADHAYRVLIESMNEGALTLTTEAAILYANQSFGRMVGCPIEQVTGSMFARFLSPSDSAALRTLVKRSAKVGSKIQVVLRACDGSQLPVQISLRSLARKGANRATIGMVVTDMTVARRSEELLRTLTQRVMQAQEAERRRVALELHDHITQQVCATLFRCQTLANRLSEHDATLKQEAAAVLEMLGKTADEAERISRGLRPSVLDELGLAVALAATTREFQERTGASVKLTCVPLPEELPAATRLTLYCILEEALKNVEQHARARHVTVRLTKPNAVTQLMIHDDGIGFDAEHHLTRSGGEVGLGLLGMRERAIFSGGTFSVKSVSPAVPGKTGTTIKVRIPRS
jgi:PAS domain S-box-containing protein